MEPRHARRVAEETESTTVSTSGATGGLLFP